MTRTTHTPVQHPAHTPAGDLARRRSLVGRAMAARFMRSTNDSAAASSCVTMYWSRASSNAA